MIAFDLNQMAARKTEQTNQREKPGKRIFLTKGAKKA